MRFDVIGGGALPEIQIRLTHSERKVERALRRLDGPEAVREYREMRGRQATTSFLRDPDTGERLYLVWMTPCTDYSAAQDAGLLAHEAVHVAADYFSEFGEDDPSYELSAYVVQDITQYLVEVHFAWKESKLRKAAK